MGGECFGYLKIIKITECIAVAIRVTHPIRQLISVVVSLRQCLYRQIQCDSCTVFIAIYRKVYRYSAFRCRIFGRTFHHISVNIVPDLLYNNSLGIIDLDHCFICVCTVAHVDSLKRSLGTAVFVLARGRIVGISHSIYRVAFFPHEIVNR